MPTRAHFSHFLSISHTIHTVFFDDKVNDADTDLYSTAQITQNDIGNFTICHCTMTKNFCFDYNVVVNGAQSYFILYLPV